MLTFFYFRVSGPKLRKGLGPFGGGVRRVSVLSPGASGSLPNAWTIRSRTSPARTADSVLGTITTCCDSSHPGRRLICLRYLRSSPIDASRSNEHPSNVFAHLVILWLTSLGR